MQAHTDSTTDAPGLVIDDVSHAFGSVTVVRNASLRVPRGSIHCLLGPSGSGKTTLLRLVAGLERLQSGRICIQGVEAASAARQLPPEDRAIGFVFQDYALFPHLNVRDNIRFGMSRRPAGQRQARVEQLLEQVDLREFERAMPHTLSGGQQQRVALARALARDPEVMLLDEPFSGLDARLRDEVREATIAVLRAAQVATIMVTHDPSEAMRVADRVSIIREGRIEQTDTPEQLYQRPRNAGIAESFGEANCFAARIAQGQVETPWGPLDAGDWEEGATVTVVLRPEHLQARATPATDTVPAEVLSRQFLGETCRIVARLPGGSTVIACGPPELSRDADRAIYLQRLRPPLIVPGDPNET